MKFALINQYAELDIDTTWRIFASLLNLKRVMVDVFVRSIEGFLMAESWTSNQAQVRVDEYFTAPRQVQSRGRKEILQELNLKSKKTLATFVSFALPKPRFDFSTNFVSSFHVNFQRKFFFLSDICSIDFIFPAKKLRKIRGA